MRRKNRVAKRGEREREREREREKREEKLNYNKEQKCNRPSKKSPTTDTTGQRTNRSHGRDAANDRPHRAFASVCQSMDQWRERPGFCRVAPRATGPTTSGSTYRDSRKRFRMISGKSASNAWTICWRRTSIATPPVPSTLPTRPPLPQASATATPQRRGDDAQAEAA